MAVRTRSIFGPATLLPAIGESFRKLNPITLARNPVIFVTEVGALTSTFLLLTVHGAELAFQFRVALWLWL
ncbi:MAG TPA: K(+)-transporting ATPase subunit B, partial [Chthoniobacterales bacterium]|nr:K(+)-transporting ATPase subunit B [Chthoniobacterales bacterium]